MKDIFIFVAIGLLSLPALAVNKTKTTSTTVYEGSSPEGDWSALEEEDYGSDYDIAAPDEIEGPRLEEQRMEERTSRDEEVDYSDRTRTNRERKAVNTGSHASDDQ